MVEKISVQIALDGGKEVEQQLAAIGNTGEKSLEQIGAAGDQANAAIIETGAAAEKAAESTSKLSLETVKTSLEIVKLTGHIALNGVEIVQAVRHHDTLIQSLLKIGSAVNTSVRALSLIQPELAGLAAGAGIVAAAVGAIAIGFEGLRKVAEATASPLAKVSQELGGLGLNTGETFDNLQRGKAAFEQLGIGGENFADIITKVNQAIRDFDPATKMKESADSLLQAEKTMLETQLKLKRVLTIADDEGTVLTREEARRRLVEITKELTAAESEQAQAEKAAKQATDAFNKARANDLETIIKLVDAIVAGQKGLTFDELTTAATKFDALTAAMKKAGDEGRTAGEVLVRFIAAADRASAIEIGAKFGLTEQQVERLQRSGGHLRTIDEIWKRIQAAGVLIPPESQAAFQQLQIEMDAVAQAKARLDQAMSTTIAATWAAQLSSALNGLKSQFLNLAATDVETLNSALTQFSQKQFFANTIRELETIGQIITSIGGQTTGFSWGELVATGGLASTRQELEAIGGLIVRAWEAVKNFTWGDLINADGFANTKRELLAIGGFIDGLLRKMGQLLSGSGEAAPALGGGEGFAAGGLLGGSGSGTSDSNLAWLSRGEHIMPARAVAQPGVLAFLEALRRSGGNLSAVLDSMGRFALGGMIRGPIPAFASGGLAGGMNHVTIQFPGLPAIGGLRASSDVVDQLHRAAALAQVRSGGRKPSRYS